MSEGPPGSIREFVEDYRRLRIAEGFASADPAFARALPFRDVTGRNAGSWRVRALHYGVIRALLALLPGSRRVLDLGAGNGWLARRLAARGRDVTALDPDATDTGLRGLDDARVRRVRGEMEALPLADGAFDVVVAAAALHYAVELQRALAEIARVLRPHGVFVLADSPLYADALARHRAWQRTRRHYDDAAAPHLARRYRGITRAELDGAGLFHFVTLAPGASPLRLALDGLRGRAGGSRLPVLAGWKR